MTKVKFIKDAYGYKAGDVVDVTLYGAGQGIASFAGWLLPSGSVVWCGHKPEHVALMHGDCAVTI